MITAIIVMMLMVLVASSYSVPTTQMLKVGDSFAYSVTAISTLQSPIIPGLSQLNQTDYIKFTITAVSSWSISYNSIVRFLNGTEKESMPNTVDLSSGHETAAMGFWMIYLPNLKVGDLIHPTGSDKIAVNQTDIKEYVNTTRERNLWFTKYQFSDANDTTHNLRNEGYTGIYFDKQTGILDTMNTIVTYNNPLKTETITWRLVNSTVWAV
jgi:hypothetical protein